MFSSIFTTFGNCFKIPELKSRILFTALLLGICRLASLIPTPGVDSRALVAYFQTAGGKNLGQGLMGMYSMFTGGGFERCAVGSLGIMPYISATIVLQLLQAVIPSLSKMAREEGGRAKLIQRGRYLTVGLCLIQGFVMAISWEHPSDVFSGFRGGADQTHGGLVLIHAIWWYRIQTTLILTTGTILLMWLGEQITDRGIGNGISLIITIGILARLPQMVLGLKDMFLTPDSTTGLYQYNIFHFAAMMMLLAAVIAGIVAVTQAQRKIPVQYAQRVVGRKTYSGGSSFMPLRVNYAGVMPVIFASAILMFLTFIPKYLRTTLQQLRVRGVSQPDGREPEPRLAALSDSVRLDDPVLLLFLGGHAVQRNPDRRRHEEGRRVCSRACVPGRRRAISCIRR